MITMGGFGLPSQDHPRDDRVGSVDVIVQAARLRDGSRRITHITEVVGMEGDVIITQDLFLYEIIGEDAERQDHRPHRSTGIAGRASGTAPATTTRKSASKKTGVDPSPCGR
jgi:pilus assembly protein CpaF